jgi:hypothetical protein
MGPELDPGPPLHLIEVIDLHDTAALLIHRVKGAVEVQNLDAVNACVEDAAAEVSLAEASQRGHGDINTETSETRGSAEPALRTERACGARWLNVT